MSGVNLMLGDCLDPEYERICWSEQKEWEKQMECINRI